MVFIYIFVQMTQHEFFMKRCLQIAALGMPNVAPNPMVGCVIVCNNEIIGEGYHQKIGEAHAEVNAINSVVDKSKLAESTLYVTLEPCSHFGKTPPCANLIVANKLKQVVVASNDPNPKVSGKGIQLLKHAGIEVVTGVLKEEADLLNRRFISFYTHKRPYVILKFAQSANAFMALSNNTQFWFSNYEMQVLSHKWRTEESAILVGRNTVTIDDCELTSRFWQGKNPTRIVIDKDCSLNSDKKVFNAEAPTIVFNNHRNDTRQNVLFVQIDFARKVVEQILNKLYELEILSVIIEGGAYTLNKFIEANLWDEARIITSNHVLENGVAAPKVNGSVIDETTIGDNALKIILNR